MDNKTATTHSKEDLAAIEEANAAFQKASLNANASTFTPAAPVNHVSVKLAEFYLSDPEMWFTQADSMFRRANITCSLTKYDYTIQKLPCDVLVSVRELARRVRAGEVDDPYEQLEDKLTASFHKSTWQKTFELLDMLDLGDCRPSVLMDAMLALLPDDVQPNRLFLALFLRCLPANLRNHLASQDLKTPEAMAAAANRLFDARLQGMSVAAVSRREARSPSPGRHRRSPSRHYHRRCQTPARRGDSTGLCFYHDNFGKQARKCEPPCSWQGKGQTANSCSN
jgi:hypothetical protein